MDTLPPYFPERLGFAKENPKLSRELFFRSSIAIISRNSAVAELSGWREESFEDLHSRYSGPDTTM
jgi:hypothetical protein